jgi:hypothetical protein
MMKRGIDFMKKYIVKGYLNSRSKQISKQFDTEDKANRFLNEMLSKYDCRVQDSRVSGNSTKFVCDDYTRFYIEERI